MSRPVVLSLVANSDWWASRNVVSVTPTAFDSRIQAGEPFGTEFGQSLLRSRRWRRRQIDVGQLVVWIDRRRPRSVRLVDRDVGQVVEDLGAAIGRGVRCQQVRAVVDERRGDPARTEVRIVDDGQQERDVRRHTAHAEFGQRAARPSDRRRVITSAARQLDQKRVEMRTDLGAQMRCAIEADARATR